MTNGSSNYSSAAPVSPLKRQRRVYVPQEMANMEARLRQSGRDNRAVNIGRNRLLITALLFVVAFSALSARLIALTLPGADSANRMNLFAHGPYLSSRAEIVDRNGLVIATNLKTALLEANAAEVPDPELAIKELTKIIPGFDQGRAREKLARGKRYMVLHNDLSPRQQQAINGLGIPGLRFVQDERRIYPADNLASHVTGYVDVDGNGITGIERSMNTQLAQGGAPLQLTLDMRVQHALRDEMSRAVKKFSAIGAAGLVMDVNNGEVIALSSLPDFDPNLKIDNKSESQFNRVTLGTYEMGSTFKVFNTAMTLDSGLADLDDVYDASEPIRISRFVISDFHGKYRPMSVSEIFLYSSNIGSAKMAMHVGAKGQQEFLRRLGLMSRPEIEIPELGTPSWPRPWPEISTMTVAYGHGIAVSPLQLGVGVSALVNGGTLVQPTLLRHNPEAVSARVAAAKRVVSEATSARMRSLLRMVVANPEGTGKQADVPGYEIGGKTGTADKQQSGIYRRDSRISSFVGVFPMSQPRYLVFVMLDEPKGIKETYNFATAGWTAAPTAGALVRRIAPMLGVAPVFLDTDDTKLAALGGAH